MTNLLLNRLGRKPAVVETARAIIIIGLGNPGREYRLTRHNIGFMVIDQLSSQLSISINRMQAKALVGSGVVGGDTRVILAKPQTFMNLSGTAVAGLLRFYKLPLENLLLIHDEMDLPFGTLRLRPSGGSSGQKGLKHTIEQLGTQDFPRLRIGVGHPPGQMAVPDYLLQDFTRGEQQLLPEIIDRAARAATTFIESGLDKAMNQYNGALQED